GCGCFLPTRRTPWFVTFSKIVLVLDARNTWSPGAESTVIAIVVSSRTGFELTASFGLEPDMLTTMSPGVVRNVNPTSPKSQSHCCTRPHSQLPKPPSE